MLNNCAYSSKLFRKETFSGTEPRGQGRALMDTSASARRSSRYKQSLERLGAPRPGPHPRLVFGYRASVSAQSVGLLSLRKKLWSFPLSILSLLHPGLPLPSCFKFCWLFHYSSPLIFVLRSGVGGALGLAPFLGCLNNGR